VPLERGAELSSEQCLLSFRFPSKTQKDHHKRHKAAVSPGGIEVHGTPTALAPFRTLRCFAIIADIEGRKAESNVHSSIPTIIAGDKEVGKPPRGV